jgi:hypothetical protein
MKDEKQKSERKGDVKRGTQDELQYCRYHLARNGASTDTASTTRNGDFTDLQVAVADVTCTCACRQMSAPVVSGSGQGGKLGDCIDYYHIHA